jgi:plasmid stabilization system protein ParE
VRRLRIDPGADAELSDSAEYYAQANPEVAWRFVQAAVDAIEAIHQAPDQWPLTPGIPEHLGVHRRRVEGFPHAIVYAFDAVEVRVLAVAHGKRRPGYWRSRL